MRRVVEHGAAAIVLAALVALLSPASAPVNDHAIANAITSNTGVATQPAAAVTTDGRWKLGGDGTCYWDANDSGPNQCAPAAEPAAEARAISPLTGSRPRV